VIDLSGQVALLTGGSRGIGRAAALLLARAGADVALTFHTRADQAETVAREIQALGRRAYVGGGDLGDPEVVDRLLAGVRREFGRLDIFVANAGIWPAEERSLANLSSGAGARRWPPTSTPYFSPLGRHWV
jgi:NAD(P)-dependent dehydrogenase (short-subunit alcohol dehydrogenase family)